MRVYIMCTFQLLLDNLLQITLKTFYLKIEFDDWTLTSQKT